MSRNSVHSIEGAPPSNWHGDFCSSANGSRAGVEGGGGGEQLAPHHARAPPRTPRVHTDISAVFGASLLFLRLCSASFSTYKVDR